MEPKITAMLFKMNMKKPIEKEKCHPFFDSMEISVPKKDNICFCFSTIAGTIEDKTYQIEMKNFDDSYFEDNNPADKKEELIRKIKSRNMNFTELNIDMDEVDNEPENIEDIVFVLWEDEKYNIYEMSDKTVRSVNRAIECHTY